MNTKENRNKQRQNGIKDARTRGAVFGQRNELGTEHPNLDRAYRNGYAIGRRDTTNILGPRFRTTGRAYTLKMFSELTQKERDELDYVKEDTNSFFRFEGYVYDLSEFAMIIPPEDLGKSVRQFGMELRDEYGDFDAWDCYQSDSYFSGIVVRYKRDEYGDFDPEKIVIGVYTS